MSYYYINSSIICVIIIGTVAIIIASHALVADLNFTEDLLNGKIDAANSVCSFVGLEHQQNASSRFLYKRNFSLLRRDLPFEPMFLGAVTCTVILCIIGVVLTWRFRNTGRVKTIMLMNKIIAFIIALGYLMCTGLIGLSLSWYDRQYYDFNDGKPWGCNMYHNHKTLEDMTCDDRFSICQKKDLKCSSFILCMVCSLLGLSAIIKEMKAVDTNDYFEEVFRPDDSFIVEHITAEDLINISTQTENQRDDSTIQSVGTGTSAEDENHD